VGDIQLEHNRQSCLNHHCISSWLVWCVVVLFVVYPLSIGPAMKLTAKGIVGRKAFIIFYTPLIKAADHVSIVRIPLNWYLENVWRID
jgi:hypothetical protein